MTALQAQPLSLHGWTEQQLQSLPHVGKVELRDGKVIRSPASFDHGFIASLILARLLGFVLPHRLGVVVDSSTGFRLANENILSPDVSFVSAGRLAALPQPLTRFFAGAPDIAVEVMSPSETRKSVQDKVQEYFDNGTRLVWIVNPAARHIEVLRVNGTTEVIGEKGTLSGEDVVPQFSMPVSEVFRPYY